MRLGSTVGVFYVAPNGSHLSLNFMMLGATVPKRMGFSKYRSRAASWIHKHWLQRWRVGIVQHANVGWFTWGWLQCVSSDPHLVPMAVFLSVFLQETNR